MKKDFIKPVVEIVEIADDVIATSETTYCVSSGQYGVTEDNLG